jgi:hypothetical protein
VHTRPFDWRDLPRLHSYRNDTLYFNRAMFLTRGPLQTLGAVLAAVVPSVGIFTAVSDGQNQSDGVILGQIIHHSGETFAYVSFLAPASNLTPELLSPLMEYLAGQIVGRGALRILAEVDERSPVVDAFRYCGFVVYTRQRIWLLAESEPKQDAMQAWRTARSQDLFAIRLLYANLVPGLVQQIEPITLDEPHGLVYFKDGELMAYVEIKYGLRGIWARPYVHPDVEEATQGLVTLLMNLPSRHARPVYVCVSAYQSWMDSLLEDLNAQKSPRQVLMVKHLTVKKKLERALSVPGLEAHPETFAFSDLENSKTL